MEDIKYLKDIGCFHLYYVESIGSTNTFLKDNFMKFPNNTLLWAGTQTNGRGRYQDRVWKSNNDYIFTYLMKDFHYNEIISPLALAEALRKYYNIETKIKWPNDIYLNDKKLSGILVENIYMPTFKASIVGLGVNKYSKPDVNGIGLIEYKDIDTLDLITKTTIEYQRLMSINFNELIKLYKNYSNVIGRLVKYKDMYYKAVNINEKGYLVLESHGQKITVTSDEIDIKTAIL